MRTKSLLAGMAVSVLALSLIAQDPQQPTQPPGANSPGSSYDPNIFQKPIPADQLAFLNQFAGAPSGDLVRDKRFRKLMHSVIPDCMFHYGRDMPLADALDMVLKGSPEPGGADRTWRAGDLYGSICGMASLWADSTSIQPMANPRLQSTSFPNR
jgi:hypothetical protein